MAAALCLALAGCGFSAPPPKRTKPPEPPPPPLSVMTVRLSLSASELTRMVNSRTEKQIADLKDQPVKCGIGKCKLGLHAVRRGPARIGAHGGGLSLYAPFHTDMQLAMPGLFSAVKARAKADGELNAFTMVAIGRDWRLVPRTQGKVRLQDSEIRLGPIKANIANIWNDNADTLSRQLFRNFDKQLANSLRVEERVARLWARSFKPVRIGKAPPLWLLLSPRRVRIGPVETANDTLTLSLGVDVRASMLAADRAPEIVPEKLPPPAPLNRDAGRFAFAVPVLLPYRQAADLALEALQKNPPRKDGRTVRIERMDILPSGEDVVIRAEFCIDQDWDFTGWFSACGRGYLRGVPTFDPQSHRIGIVKLRYDMETENLLMRVARSLVGPEIGRDIESKLQYDLSKRIADMRARIEAAIARPHGREVTIQGHVESFGDPVLAWTKDGFLATFTAKGNVRAEAHL